MWPSIITGTLVASLVTEPPDDPERGREEPPARSSAGKLQRAVTMQRIGGVTLGVGGGSMVAAGILYGMKTRALNRVAAGISPGPLGFPSARWRDLADDDRLAGRLRVASMVTLGVGSVLVVGGAILLIEGTRWRRRLRERGVGLAPGGLVIRW